jgi:hypothetical protein
MSPKKKKLELAGNQKIKFYDEVFLSKKPGIDRRKFHREIKPIIISDFPEIIKELGCENPDIGLDASGNLYLANIEHTIIKQLNLVSLIIFKRMTETSYIDIQFKGKGFVPTALSEGINLPIETLVSTGELGKVGRYKGKPVPYGIGLLKINPTADMINKYSELLLQNKAKLKKYNVEEIIFDVDANSTGLKKISISSNLLKKLSSLNARIQFNNYQLPESDSPSRIDNGTAVSTTLNKNKKKIEDFLSTASKSEIRNLIISLLENPENNNTIFKKNFKKVAE